MAGIGLVMLGPVAGQAELTSRQRRSLAEDGYLLVPSLLAADVVAALAARLDELARAIIAEADAAAGEQWEEAGVVRVRLDPADPGYALLVRQPQLFSAGGCGYRARLPGGRPELARAVAGVRPPGPAPGLLPRAPHQRAVAGIGRHVVHHRIHPRRRAAADNPRLSSFGP
jgi:hypothetical protein